MLNDQLQHVITQIP